MDDVATLDPTALDYIVTKPASFHLTAEEAERLGFDVDTLDWGVDDDENPAVEGEVTLAHGVRIPGDIAESWGSGRTVNHLCNNRILAAVPADGSEPLMVVPTEPAAADEPSPGIVDELEALKARVAELEAEKSTLLTALEVKDAFIEVAQPESLSEWGSEEWLAGWFDDTSVEKTVASIEEWGTGEGTVESPSVLKPDDDAIRSMLEHEATHGNREEVLAALEAQLNKSPIVEGAPAETESFPKHKAGGVFTLSDGSEVKGKKPAIAAQAELDAKNEA